MLLLNFNCVSFFLVLLAYASADDEELVAPMAQRPKKMNIFGEPGQAYSIKVFLGSRHETFDMIVDTGSASLAVAGYPREDSDKYYLYNKSAFSIDAHKKVQAKYSQGSWTGNLVSDSFDIDLPGLENEHFRVDFAVINASENFFMNGSKWQGILGLAYKSVNAWGDFRIRHSGSVLDAISCFYKRRISFEFKLCGPVSPTNLTHYGSFWFTEERSIMKYNEPPKTFYTPILRERWYEIGVLGVHVVKYQPPSPNSTDNNKRSILQPLTLPNPEECWILNAEKCILDTGTTNIRLPDVIFKRVVDEMRAHADSNDSPIADEFWYQGKAACWPELQDWTELPWLAVDLLLSMPERSYFTLLLPPQSYMRGVYAYEGYDGSERPARYCYKLGLEAGGKDTVLGYTAMEGFEVIFSRWNQTIGWASSDCGPSVHVVGPYFADFPIVAACGLIKPGPQMPVSIQAVQWALLTVSLIAATILLYILLPCVKHVYKKQRRSVTELLVTNEAGD